MRRLLIAAAFPLLSLLPASAGDLGIHDEYLSGVRVKDHRYDQLEFDLSGEAKALFKSGKLEIVLTERMKNLINNNKKAFSHLSDNVITGEKWISPDQVISYDYHVQHLTGVAFKIFYRDRAGDKSLATFVFRDENTAKAFHNTFLLWLNNKLPAGNAEQK